LPFAASFSRLNDRLNAFFERIQDHQLLGKAKGCTLPAPRSFLSKDVRYIRVSRARIFHGLKLGCLQRIRNGRLRAKIRQLLIKLCLSKTLLSKTKSTAPCSKKA